MLFAMIKVTDHDRQRREKMNSFMSLICALDFIENNLRRKVSVNQVAAASYTSLSHLQSMFRRTLKVSIGDYVTKRKLCLAARDLIETESSVTEIAFDFGYSSLESFSRAFKKQFLSSPSVYRKTHKYCELFPPLVISEKEGFKLTKIYDLTEISEAILASKGTYVINADIDDMRGLNEKWGREAGDRALAETAARITRSAGETIKSFRIGADHFIVLTKSDDLEAAETIAQKIISAAGEPVEWSGGTFDFSLSMGIVKIPEDISEAEEILERSTEAMVAAKRKGRNCYKVF